MANGLQSMDSVRSATSIASSATPQERKEEEAATSAATSELLNKDASIQDAVFGVLYTVGKEKFTGSWKIAIGNILLDFIQILLFIINERNPWSINYHNVLFRWFNRLNLKNPIIGFGYSAFNAVFYIGMSLLFASAALCGYVAYNFKTDSFPYVWPIKALRFFVSIFLDAFYISSLNVFLVGPDCNLVNSHTTAGVFKPKGYSDTFTDVKCLAFPNVLLFIFGLLSTSLAIVISYLMVSSSAELDLLSPNLLASSHCNSEVRIWLTRTSVTIVSVLLSNYQVLQSAFLLSTSSYLCYNVFRRVPYYHWQINCLRCGLYAILSWASMLCVILLKNPDKASMMTTILFAGGIPVGLVAACACYWRIRHAWRIGYIFFYAHPEVESVRYKFLDDTEVEVVSRCCRNRSENNELVQEWVDAADAVMREGLRQFPNSAFLQLHYANFLFTVKQSYQSAAGQLSRARKARMDFSQKFMVFVRDRERKQRSGSDASGNGSMDLVSYVEFQNNYKAILLSHMASLRSVRQFWRELLRKDVTFTGLSKALTQMDMTEAKAEKVYRVALERYPKSVKLLRIYGKFLEDVRNDPWLAGKYYREAERLEDLQNETQRDQLIAAQGENVGVAALIDDSSDAVVVINEMGIIQFTNRPMNRLFGYRKGELEGKNVSVLMPPPYSTNHNNYLRAYKQRGGGPSSILGQSREVVAVHKQRHVFISSLTITRIAQGESEAFLGVFKPTEDDTAGNATVYLTITGMIVVTNQAFSSMFGYKSNDVVGKNFVRLVAADPADLERELKHLMESAERLDRPSDADGYGPADYEDDRPSVEITFMARHRFGNSTFRVGLFAKLGGTSHARIVTISMNLVDSDRTGVVAIDQDNGNIHYISGSLEAMLGYQEGSLSNGNVPLSRIMPSPYAFMHQKFVADWSRSFASAGVAKHRSISCAAGRMVPFLTKDGKHVPCLLELSMTPDSDKLLFAAVVHPIVKLSSRWIERPDQEEVLISNARLRLLVDSSGNILLNDAPPAPQLDPQDAPEPLFGLFREDLEESVTNLCDLADVFADAVANSRLFNPETRVDQVLPPLLKRMAENSEELGIASWRCGVDAGPGLQVEGYRSALMVVGDHRHMTELSPMVIVQSGLCGSVDDVAEALNGTHGEVFMVDLYQENKLQGLIELDRQGTIRTVSRAAAILLGQYQSSLPDCSITSFMTNAGSSAKITNKLGLKLGKQLGDRTMLEFQRPDNHVFAAQGVACVKGESRLQLLIHTASEDIVTDPLGSFRVLQELLYGGANRTGGNALDGGREVRGVRFAGGPAPPQPAGVRSSATNPPTQSERVRASGTNVGVPSSNRTSGTNVNGGMRGSVTLPSNGYAAGRDSPQLAPTNSGMPAGASSISTAVTVARAIDRFRKAGGASAPPPEEDVNNKYDDPYLPNDPGAADADTAGDQESTPPENVEDSQDVANFRRAKKFKRLKRLLTSAKARRSITTLVLISRLVAIIIMTFHIGTYAGISVLADEMDREVSMAKYEGEIRESLHNMLIAARRLSEVGSFYPASMLPTFNKDLVTATDEFESVAHYILYGVVTRRGFDRAMKVLNKGRTATLRWVPPTMQAAHFKVEIESAWDIIRNTIRSARLVANTYSNSSSGVPDDRNYRYMTTNGPDLLFAVLNNLVSTLSLPVVMKHLALMVKICMALFVVEGAFLIPMCGLVLYIAIKRVLLARTNLYSIFLYLPRPMVLALATKEIKLDEDESEDDMDDDVDFERTVMKGTAEKDSKSMALDTYGTDMKIKIDPSASKRHLKTNPEKDLLKLTAPFAFCAIVLLVFSNVMMSLLGQFRAPMEILHYVEDIGQLNCRVRLFAHELLFANTEESVAMSMFHLNDTMTLMLETYNGILLGDSLRSGSGSGANVSESTRGSGLLTEKPIQNLLFGHGCMRDLSHSPPCLPADDIDYEASNRGLDQAINSLRIHVNQLLRQYDDIRLMPDPADSEPFRYIANVGRYDIQDGLHKFESLVMKDTKKLIVEFIDIGTAFLVIFIISNILNVIAIGPFISMTNVESKRVAELMSLLPDNMDVESLIVQAGGLQDDDSDDEQSGQRKTDDKVKKKRKKRGLFKRLYQAWKDDGEEQPQGKKGSDGEDEGFDGGLKNRSTRRIVPDPGS